MSERVRLARPQARRTAETAPSRPAPASDPASVADVLQDPGSPLDASLRASAEEPMGFDFGPVGRGLSLSAPRPGEFFGSLMDAAGPLQLRAADPTHERRAEQVAGATRGRNVDLRSGDLTAPLTSPPALLQREEGTFAPGFAGDAREAVRLGLRSPTAPMPFMERLGGSLPGHDLSRLRPHLGPEATASAWALGALGFTVGDDVVFAGTPSLHTVAHETAHAIQQRGGLRLPGGVGQAGDPYEREADAVAERVVAGVPATDLLGGHAGHAGAGVPALQRRPAGSPELQVPAGQSPDAPEPDPEPPRPDPAELVVELGEDVIRQLLPYLRSPRESKAKFHDWFAATFLAPIRLSKIVSFTLKLREEIPNAIKYYQDAKLLDPKKLETLAAATTAGVKADEKTGELKTAAELARGYGRRYRAVQAGRGVAAHVQGLANAELGAEKLAVQIRTATGYLAGDYKTIGRHIFITGYKAAIEELSAAWTMIASQTIETAIKQALLEPEVPVQQLVERYFGYAQTQHKTLYDRALKAVIEAKDAAALKAAANAEKLAEARKVAGEGGVLTGDALKLAEEEAANFGLAKRSGVVRKISNLLDRGVKLADRGVTKGVRKILERYNGKMIDALKTVPLDKVAEAAAKGEPLAAVVKAEVSPLLTGVLKAGKYAGPAAALISAAVTVQKSKAAFDKAAEARRTGDETTARFQTYIGVAEGLHTLTDLSGAIPGIGTVISLGGDVVFISVVWVIEANLEAAKKAELDTPQVRQAVFRGIDSAEAATEWVKTLSDDDIREALPFDDKVRLMTQLARFAVAAESVRAFQRLYYRQSDGDTAARLRAAVEPRIENPQNQYNKWWLPTLRRILEGKQGYVTGQEILQR